MAGEAIGMASSKYIRKTNSLRFCSMGFVSPF